MIDEVMFVNIMVGIVLILTFMFLCFFNGIFRKNVKRGEKK